MADYLALDWEKHQLSGLDARVERTGVVVRQCFRLAWPEDHTADPAQAGHWLKTEVDRLQIHSRQAVVSLPREDVVVRPLEVPDVADEELPDLVRLQAETKASSSLDRTALDFLPLASDSSGSSGSRHVLMVTVSREKLQQVQRTLDAAGVELLSVGISPVATAELIAQMEQDQQYDPDGTCLLVTRHGQRVEISFMRSRRLLFAHSTQIAGEDAEDDARVAVAEIRRSQGALMRIDPAIDVRRAWVIGAGEETRSLADSLREQLSCEVQTLDPLTDVPRLTLQATMPGAHGPFAGPVGLLLARTGSLAAGIDLLHPRRQVVRRDRRKLRLAATTAGIGLIAVAVYAGIQRQASRLDSEIETAQQQLSNMKDALERGRSTMQQAAIVREWKQRDIDLLDQMQSLRKAAGSTERLYFSDLRYVSSSGRTGQQFLATGHSRSRGEVERLYQKLSESGYVVNPHEISRSSSDSEYPFQFDLEIRIPLSFREG